MWYRQIEWVDPVEAAARLHGLPALSFLDSAMARPSVGRFSYVAADPFGIFHARHGKAYWNGSPESSSVTGALKARRSAYRCDRVEGLPPFQGGAIGAFAYEWGWSLEGRTSPHAPRCDDVHLAFYDTVVAFDHVERTCFILASGCPDTSPNARRQRAESRLSGMADRLTRPSPRRDRRRALVSWRSAVSRDAYRTAVDKVKAYILEGDIYQANIARRFTADMPSGFTPWQMYRVLRDANPAPFGAYLECGTQTVLSTSPELFLRLDGRDVETRPIKGTCRRGADDATDRRAAQSLLGSQKDRAENVMIVDLLRNDLSKVCRADSVHVPILCGLETYAGLHHLVSAVTGTLRDDADAVDLLAATFPGGSITGAPKLRAMEIIAEIEGRSRGLYCGAIGAIGFDGSLNLNIAIRTLIAEGRTIELSAGGGITMLSDPDQEYEETITKAQRIFDGFRVEKASADALA